MHSFFGAFFDTLFPLSSDARCVRDATVSLLEGEYRPHLFGRTIVLTEYHRPLIRACIHEAKFRHNERAVALLGYILGAHVRKSSHAEIHLVPIPLSAKRLAERGYNQVLEIATATQAHALNLSVHHTLLQKIRHTPSQTSLSRTERLENLKGVFSIGEHALRHDAPIIVFDDIVTTGSTLNEASRTLRDAGFTHITKLAFAH